MNISFLTSGHDPFDDRIFYHMDRTLFTGLKLQNIFVFLLFRLLSGLMVIKIVVIITFAKHL